MAWPLPEGGRMKISGVTRRRSLLVAAGSASVGAGWGGGVSALGAAMPVLPTGACMVMPEDIQGPYYLDHGLERSDITEGRPGVPLSVRLQVLGVDCQPIPGARVDLWQADSQGIYSGYAHQGDGHVEVDARGQTYLSGIQYADGRGEVGFTTIYPGWYRGRTPHIHAKVYLSRVERLNLQLYFPDALSEAIFASVPEYRRGLARDTLNANDTFLPPGRVGFVSIRELADHYEASLVIAVDPNRAINPPVIRADVKTHPRMDATAALPAGERERALFPHKGAHDVQRGDVRR